MKRIRRIMTFLPLVILAAGLLIQITVKRAQAGTFESGSTCGVAFYNSSTCRGAFSPTVNTTVQLPPNGILDYTTFTIPSGVTVYYAKNAANTPVIIRTSGDVRIEGSINVSAMTSATNSGTYGDGNLGDDGQPGTGGPGGFDGGYGGLSSLFGGAAFQLGGAGKGPGGGLAGPNYNSNYTVGGGGGGFGTAGVSRGYGMVGGSSYGQATLLPLLGGSGGGGGLAGTTYNGAGGGGGGGAILIAAGTASSPATITVGKNGTYGYIYADGGGGGNSAGSGCGGEGGGGSGGAIRLVANTLACPNGYCAMYARGGNGGNSCWNNGGNGAAGIIRIEANNITTWTTGNTNPAYSTGLPGHVLVPKDPVTLLDPTIRIVSVTPTSGASSGVTANAPANPTGNADITFPTGTTTATVSLVATGIPSGSTADVHVIPASGATRSKVLSTAFSVPDVNGVSTATATVTLSPGNNVLQAAVTYTVTELVAMNLPKFNGEYVAKIRVEGGMDGKSQVTYITASGKEYPAGKAKA
jgi:hypothetical protein